MRIGVIQRDDTRSVLSSSGTLYYMTRALEQHVGTVIQLGPDRSLASRGLLTAGKVFNKISVPLLKRRISPIHQRLLSVHAARLFGPRIEQANCDVLYAPFASVEIAGLSTSVPIVYHTDMTWADAVGYYSIYSSLFPFAREAGEQIQRDALKKARAAIFPSEWAARSAIDHYGMEPGAVSVVPYGANFDPEELPSTAEAVERHVHSEVSLLWIGVDWVRKGGPIAYDCLLTLLESNVDASLTVCGCTPPSGYSHPRMRVIPFLSKGEPAQRSRLLQLFTEATFFVFPTTSEAAAIVLCEASAHGLPSLVPDTGGIRTVVRDGVNGYVLPKDAPGKEYAGKIMELLLDPEGYVRLLRTSRQAYEDTFNWDTWGRAVRPIFERAVLATEVPATK